ncbi:hypothetical protein ATANTOWER_031160 [Ataeniobius toweri]|uniref:Uncharacterized protein n=1 Tax=Ataeniobius toweri TaxID=208326 RepID=A0ABU7A9L8_9TELE|nr:hypothetical protein [Ataeniobius toweri]
MKLTQGWMSSTIKSNVRSGLLHLLNAICDKFHRESSGCNTGHSSPNRHQCPSDVDEDYYQLHYDRASTLNFASQSHYSESADATKPKSRGSDCENNSRDSLV